MGKREDRARNHEVRELKWKLKQANKQRGQQSEVIHNLRGEVALYRERIRMLQRSQIVYTQVDADAPNYEATYDGLPESCIEGLA